MKRTLGAKTLVYPTPVFVVGSYDQEDRPNAMTASWAGLVCSAPPCMGVSLRKSNYSYGNILHHKAFTISIPSQEQIKKVDFLALTSGRNVDKFRVARLTPVQSDLVHAPYVKEFPVVLECRLLHTLELGLHTLFIGEILDAKAEETVLGTNGLSVIEKVKPMLFDPDTQRYFAVGECLGQAFSIGKEP